MSCWRTHELQLPQNVDVMPCRMEFKDQVYNTYLSWVLKLYLMLSRHVLLESRLYIIWKESKETHSIGRGFLTGVMIWDPWKQDRTTNKALCHSRTWTSNEVWLNMLVNGTDSWSKWVVCVFREQSNDPTLEDLKSPKVFMVNTVLSSGEPVSRRV